MVQTVNSAFSSDQASPSAALRSSSGTMPSPAKGHSEHATRGNLADALNRTLSWDLPQPPRRKEKIRQNIDQLHPPTSAPLNEDGLPTPEPFKVKMVETITLLPRGKREALIERAGYNVFCLRSDQVFIDLLTDSGTSAMSDVQWANMLNTPQAYAGSSSFYTLEGVVQDLFGFKHVLPEHQGRAAENVLFSTVVAPKPGCWIPNNTHFDTTEANVLRCGGHPVNLAVPEAYETGLSVMFKGNMDTAALEAFIDEKGVDNVPLIMITVTNNSAGGQPVSMENVQKVSEIARRHKIPFFIDAARFAENCWFIQRWEPGYSKMPLREIARKLFSYADGCTFSGKKEALANVGGLLCCNDDKLYEELRNLTIVVEGYPTYGGLACRDLMAMARGLLEVTDEAYQVYRHGQIELLAGLLRDAGVPIVEPPGGHAVYVDAKRFLPHIPPEQFPAQALTAALYAVSGVRGVEIGSSCFGHIDEETGEFIPARLELLRLALPRRVYSDNHLRYVAAAIIQLYKKRDTIAGLQRVYATKLLSHFTARFQPIGAADAVTNSTLGTAAAAAGDAVASAAKTAVDTVYQGFEPTGAAGSAANVSVSTATAAAVDAISTASDAVANAAKTAVDKASQGLQKLGVGGSGAAAEAPLGDAEEGSDQSDVAANGVHDSFAQAAQQPFRQQQAW